ncbi:MAG: hypothetical protein QOD59_4232 [Mycobacterium sp.]|jgi:hypothetical protein|nr:hypothetical protein [Mycobacterium sp.]
MKSWRVRARRYRQLVPNGQLLHAFWGYSVA